MFLAQNIVLVALALVIAWVTFFPLISEAITGTQISVGPPAFRPYVVPLALAVVALSGIGPIIPWRRVTFPSSVTTSRSRWRSPRSRWSCC